MGLRKRVMTDEGELWKRVGAEQTLRGISETSRTSVAAYRGGSVRLTRRRENGGVTAREHTVSFERELTGCVWNH